MLSWFNVVKSQFRAEIGYFTETNFARIYSRMEQFFNEIIKPVRHNRLDFNYF